MITPNKLKIGDIVVYGILDAYVEKWKVMDRLNAKCLCGRNKGGWIVKHRGKYTVFFDDDTYIWKNAMMLDRYIKIGSKGRIK
jgi:hypothetical protein